MTLADLKPGQHARIIWIETGEPEVHRLMVMGLVEGADVVHLRRSLGGDPIEFRVQGAAISLRREQAKRFGVQAVEDHGESR